MTETPTPAPESQPSPADGAPPVAAPQPAAGPDLSWIGADFQTDGQPDLGRFREHYEGLLAEDARRREAPTAPADGRYDLTIPADLDFGDFKPPEGVKIELLADDPHYAPVFDELQAFLHQKGLPQDTATGLVGLLAKYQAAQHIRAVRETAAEFEKLGATPAARDARVQQVRRSLEARLPADQAQALVEVTRSAGAIRALEALIAKNAGPLAAVQTPQKPSFDGLRGSKLLDAARMAAQPRR